MAFPLWRTPAFLDTGTGSGDTSSGDITIFGERQDTMLNGQLNMVSPSVLGHLSANLIIDDVQLYFKDLC